MVRVVSTPLDKARIRYLVTIWNTQNMDSRSPEDYNMWEVNKILWSPVQNPNRSTEIYEVRLASTVPGIATLEFQIDENVYLEFNAITAPEPQPRTRNFNPAPQPVGPRVTVQYRRIPRSVSMPDDGIEGHGFRCDNCTDNRYWCDHVVRQFSSGIDQHTWLRSVDNRGKIRLAVPLFGEMYHRILISKETITSWDGKDEARLLIDPESPYLAATYQEITDTSAATYTIARLHETLETPIGKDIRNGCERFHSGQGPPLCGNTSHGYGANQQLEAWLGTFVDSWPSASWHPDVARKLRKLSALTFCILTYGVCYICWLNRESALSLLD
jgi:hypothetical protein